jgi:hypothetical protein
MMNVVRRARWLLAAPLAASASMLGCAADTVEPAASESTESSQQALQTSFNDANTLEANTVVFIDGFEWGKQFTTLECTGTLITPTAVLTSKHCVTGSSGGLFGTDVNPIDWSRGVGVWIGNEKLRTKRYAARWTNFYGANAPTTTNQAGQDLAILWLDTPVLEDAKIVRPSLVPPVSITQPDYIGGTYQRIGLSGWAAVTVNGSTFQSFRQVAYFPSLDVGHSANFPSSIGGQTPGQVWIRQETAAELRRGDSGGPLFVLRQDGGRDVIGVASQRGFVSFADCNGGTCNIWTDITRGEPARWLRSVMTDTSRTPSWKAKHPGYLWKGEVDYTGPCQASVDYDCDHWYNWSDNCILGSNPAQIDSNDDGLGDGCI